MSLSNILQIERARVLRERVVLVTVYDRMKNRINNSVTVRAKECIYTIPEFIPGYPLINPVKTMDYLLTKLKKEGFIAAQLSKFDLCITWDPEKIRQLDQLDHQIKSTDSNRTEQLYSKIDRNKPLWNEDNQRMTVDKQLLDKQFERANENFINALVISKKSSTK